MNEAAADVQAMVDRVNEVAIPADFGGSFWEEFDAWLFANSGAEIRNFLRIVDNRLVLTNAQRSNTTEQLVFSTPSLSDMEKFLTYYFCDSLREDRRLPMLLVVSIPVTVDKAAEGFSIAKAEGLGYELHCRGESVVRRGRLIGLVKFSHYVALTPEEIRASALDPEGKPHFMVDTRT
ncbi:Imm61 family immunity protein [Leifsonia sp. WHRI 6310E]|uniref:Imm61 family immunity protein n=1 Tax=Leifsonia sp. WHRI 6310E TaxID=3162562 RepID=UPI0032EAEDB9